MAAWRREFVAIAEALVGGSGWALLSYARWDGRLYNQLALDDAHVMMDSVPILALDMYEHAYHSEFGANARAYIEAFLRNLDWTAVAERLVAAVEGGSTPALPAGDQSVPSIGVDELAQQIAAGERLQVIDARPRFHYSRGADMMAGAVYRDPERVDEWFGELSTDSPVVVYCSYGFNVGCAVTGVLRERGLDARYVRGGLSAWYAAGGERAMKS
jgi:Fe-Mn family superoxide dismutase